MGNLKVENLRIQRRILTSRTSVTQQGVPRRVVGEGGSGGGGGRDRRGHPIRSLFAYMRLEIDFKNIYAMRSGMI